MPNVGYATIAIIPSVRGIADELRRQLVGPAGAAGGDAGQAAGGGLKDKLKVGAAAAGAAAGALLVAGISEAMEQANVTSTLQAQLGTTDKVAAAQGKVAGRLYSSGIAESFQDAAEAIKSVVQAGLAPPGTTNAQLQAIATKASDVANIFGQDLGGVTNAVSQMLRTGLARNADEAFDLITKGFQSGADKAGDFLDTLNEYGTQFRKAGVAGPAAIGLINQALRAGARDGDLAADAIKEFSIRAIDGSDSTKDGFKALGLSADDMAKKFAKGGSAANGVLDLTLDKLRGIKDPVKQAQIATQLFGTQAEDLGKALFAMDPSSAAAGLGKVGGAAAKAGQAIHSGPSHEIEVFTRTLKQGFVEFIGGQVLPTVSVLAHGFNALLPPIRLVGASLAATLVPALVSLWKGGVAVVGWLRDMGTWLIPVAIAVGGFTAAILAQQIATAAVTAVFAIYRGAILAWTTVQKAATIAQAAFNAVMNANPIILVITAIVALSAAMYVAYQRSETFRAIVQAAFQGIKTVALAVYNWFAGPFVSFFTKTVPAAFGTALSWVKANWPWLFGALTGPLGLATVYIIKHWGQVQSAFGAGWSWIKTNVLFPIGTFFTRTVPGWATTLKDKTVAAFDGARAGIKTAWDKIKAIARAPIQYVVDVVYNNGIRGVWNKVAGVFGAPKLPEYKFASGGVLPGYTPGRDVHLAALSGGEAVMRPEWTRAVGPGYVHSMNAAARSGGVGAIRRMVSGGMPAFADGGIFGWVKGAASKGVDLVKSGASWLKDGIKESALAGLNKVVKPLIDRIAGSASLYRTMITGIPKRMISSILGFSGQADKKLSAAGIGGGGFASALNWARAQAGKPYVWGGVGPAGFDCSGFMGAIENVIRGMRPNSRRWATGAFGSSGPAGWVRNARSPFMIGITNAGVGHTAGTLNGVNVESRGGDGVVVGKSARGYNASLFTSHWGLQPRKYDNGGWLQPGVTATVNATGRPEAVLTASQWRVMSSAADGGRPIVVEVHTRDQSLADFIDVRVQERDRALIRVINAS
jgi:phage-related minor tail protein